MTDRPIVVVRGGEGRSLTEQITEVLGKDVVLVVEDLGEIEREMFDRLDAPLRLPEPIVMEIAMREQIKMMAEPIYLDRPAKDWQDNQRKRRMKPRRR